MELTILDYVVALLPVCFIIWVAWVMRKQMKGVGDFLAANRCAGRFLICTAVSESGATVMAMMTQLEVFMVTGFSLNFWNQFAYMITFMLTVLGFITVRYRETRAMTFHEMLEVRYSKNIRVFSSVIQLVSGLFFFGIQPAVAARFFVHFTGMSETLTLGGAAMPTYIPLMIIFLGVSLFFAFSGGQISVIIADSMDGLISTFLYLIVAFSVLMAVSHTQIMETLLMGDPGKSFIDPFDISGQKDFNGAYIFMTLLWGVYVFRGSAWSAGFIAAAKTPHESRMAQILSGWRWSTYGTMTILMSIGALVVMKHPDFAVQQAEIAAKGAAMENAKLVGQMEAPAALSVIMAPGIKGAFLFIVISGIIASFAGQLHSRAAALVQDIALPRAKFKLTEKQHVLALRMAAVAVALFTIVFSIWYKPMDYLVMLTTLIGAIYTGGIGIVIWGGLYWKRGTTAGAWTAMTLACLIAGGFNILTQFWVPIHHWASPLIGAGGLRDLLLANPERPPLNGLQLSIFTGLTCIIGYVAVSLLTSKQPFNMDKMLHRGEYRLEDEVTEAIESDHRPWLHKILNIDKHFSKGDRIFTIFTFLWMMFWKVVGLSIILWVVFIGHPSDKFWLGYVLVNNVGVTMISGIVMAFVFIWGITKDMLDMFRTLKTGVRTHDTGQYTEDGETRPDKED
jgi:SSS family solute:Na+ symporter